MKKLRLVFVMLLLLFTAVGVFCSLEPTGLAKPIADLRDYNGTYFGAPGTGTIGYIGGTLYRDNQDSGAVSGCRGEGCGRHSGVDIPVPSGTGVFASQSGTVVISRCDAMWGGLVVIRAYHPWDSGRIIYYTYAHLRARRFSNGKSVLVGDYVSTGNRIGESGGGAGDVCAGRSTGSHLHFQIDKDDGNSEPFYPDLVELNKVDSSFIVVQKTFNPIVFVTGGYRWGFERRGDNELWEVINSSSFQVSGGNLIVDFGWDPYIRRWGYLACGYIKKCSSNISAEAGEYFQIYLQGSSYCYGGAGKVYFTTKQEPWWDENKSIWFYNNYGSINEHIKMSDNSKWVGVITSLRVDISENCNPFGWDPVYLQELTLER